MYLSQPKRGVYCVLGFVYHPDGTQKSHNFQIIPNNNQRYDIVHGKVTITTRP